MRQRTRLLGGVAAALLLLVALSPWLTYALVLSRFDTLPARPGRVASAEQQAWVWALARGTGVPNVAPMNPYRVLNDSFFTEPSSPSAGETLAYWVAREHVRKLPPRRMAWWHLSNAALAIWLTRHWSSEELASAAYAIAIRWTPRKPRTLSADP
jgi:hypothetical protein